MFSVSYDGVNIAPVSLNNLTAESLQRALNNLTSIRKQGHATVTEMISSKNSTVYTVTFYFKNPEETQMLLAAPSNMTSVKITYLQKGNAQKAISYSEPSGSSDSGWSPREGAIRPWVRE